WIGQSVTPEKRRKGFFRVLQGRAGLLVRFASLLLDPGCTVPETRQRAHEVGIHRYSEEEKHGHTAARIQYLEARHATVQRGTQAGLSLLLPFTSFIC